jgi:DNA/RNA-binding domain of Phe-tRNA-synthetase-like protein
MPPLHAEVDSAILERYPGYVARILVLEEFAHGPTSDASDRALREAERSLHARDLERAADHPHIASWRAAFSAFGAKPSRYPCSAEALAARVLKGGELPRVNHAVDLYNAVSVRHLVPVGGEDLDRICGGARLTFAVGAETFDGDDGSPEPGEVVWRDQIGVTCRRWNWRQGVRTRLTEHSTRGYFVFDRLDGLDLDELDQAVDELAAALGGRPHVMHLG